MEKSPVWKERGRMDEVVEERQQGEGESASETCENVGGVKGYDVQSGPAHYFMTEESEGGASEEQVPLRPEGGSCHGGSIMVEQDLIQSLFSGLRRSLSEGSLLLEPPSPRFLSDSTIHRLIRPSPDLKPVACRPSIQALRDQLTLEGGSLNHMLLLLNGTKVGSRTQD